ncbi:kinase family protein [Dorcoceras hygrometricum]|uniref:Kinase family protein n=1 Tax=Dorcoceras hygrometricum TaxID=472368 RepID=A0A2Z7C9B2_9LAMI|nr:kinase family protein [Dorcoceras hygrometricum]
MSTLKAAKGCSIVPRNPQILPHKFKQGTAALTTRNQQLSRSSPRSFCSFKWVAIEREVRKEPSATESTQIFDRERRKSKEEMSRNLTTGTHASYNKPDATIQSQLSSRKLSSRNPRNAAFQLNQTTLRCSLEVPQFHSWSSSRNTIPPTTGSSIHRLVILSRAQRFPDATQAQQLIFHFHQLQATVTIKFQILPVVGYSTVDSILGGIRQL